MKTLALLSTIAVLMIPGLAAAGEIKAYTEADFKAAQAAGAPILVDITASWCPTCKAQKPIIQSLAAETEGLTVFEVDFDAQKDVVRGFKAQMQSTLIAFKGEAETGRSVGDTNADSIKALVQGAL